VLKVRCERAGIEYITAHDLRHAAASWADSQGANVRQIQKLLGHTQLQTTMRYTHGDPINGSKTVQNIVQSMRDKAIQNQQA
jgi:integrase